MGISAHQCSPDQDMAVHRLFERCTVGAGPEAEGGIQGVHMKKVAVRTVGGIGRKIAHSPFCIYALHTGFAVLAYTVLVENVPEHPVCDCASWRVGVFHDEGEALGLLGDR